MVRAFSNSDAEFDGIFYVAVRSTGIFCRPSCRARKPLLKNVEFFPRANDALFAGYRPCLKCRPLEAPGELPEKLQPLLAAIQAEPEKRWRDQDLRNMGLSPPTVRRWFKRVHGMTFHAYARARRLGAALSAIGKGAQITRVALDHGYESLSGFGEAVVQLTGNSPRGSRRRGQIRVARINTPIGPMLAASHEHRLCLLEFADRRQLETQFRTLTRRLDALLVPGWSDVLDLASRQLQAYFNGQRLQFELPLAHPGTDFQVAVWKALMRIPAGETRSYQALAESLGRPDAVRAVARANGDNRLAIVVPCHRVIGKDGRLTGYGGGLWRKQRLLELERTAARPGPTPSG
jgi:AraC family transcriptional regulator of adaptative response/methylated-DNA-[protein]-cysteine methyltransferase